MPEKPQQNGTYNDCGAYPDKESAKKKSKILARYVSILNYFCVEHFFLSGIFILGLTFIGIGIQLHYSNASPHSWLEIGGLIVGAYIIFAGVWLVATRSKKTPEELEEEYRTKTAQAIAHLSSGLVAIQKHVSEQAEKIGDIEKTTKPRRLTEDQINGIAGYLRFRNHVGKFAVRFNRAAPDAFNYASDFHRALELAGWTNHENAPAIDCDYAISLCVNPKDYPPSAPHILSLIQLLLGLGIIPQNCPMPTNAVIPESELFICIGYRG